LYPLEMGFRIVPGWRQGLPRIRYRRSHVQADSLKKQKTRRTHP
jgi:hypothetical protein